LTPSLSLGDAGDWYSLRTPIAANAFGSQDLALLSSQDVQLDFQDPNVQDLINNYLNKAPTPRSWLFVYPAKEVTVNGSATYEPVDQVNGVPDHYLIHVVNPNDYAVIAQDAASPALQTDAVFDFTIDGVGYPEITVAAHDYNDAGEVAQAIQAQIDQT